MPDWQIERLDPAHDRADFQCGKAPLDDFLRSLVSQYEKQKLGRTYGAIRPGDTNVLGYYTLASGSVPFANLPPGAAKKLPKHPVPVVLLGRLAVDQSARGRRLGESLLTDALRRCLELSEKVGLFAVEVQAIDAEAKAFYEKYSFVSLLDNPWHLDLPLKTVEQALAGRRSTKRE